MELIVARSRELLESMGPMSFGFYTSGQLFSEEYYAQTKVARAGLGTPHLDGNTRLCTAMAEWALIESFGCDGDPGSYADIDHGARSGPGHARGTGLRSHVIRKEA